MRFNILDWSYDGRRLDNPLMIIRRLALWPLYQATRLALVIVAYIGFGKYTAESVWEDTK